MTNKRYFVSLALSVTVPTAVGPNGETRPARLLKPGSEISEEDLRLLDIDALLKSGYICEEKIPTKAFKKQPMIKQDYTRSPCNYNPEVLRSWTIEHLNELFLSLYPEKEPFEDKSDAVSFLSKNYDPKETERV